MGKAKLPPFKKRLPQPAVAGEASIAGMDALWGNIFALTKLPTYPKFLRVLIYPLKVRWNGTTCEDKGMFKTILYGKEYELLNRITSH